MSEDISQLKTSGKVEGASTSRAMVPPPPPPPKPPQPQGPPPIRPPLPPAKPSMPPPASPVVKPPVIVSPPSGPKGPRTFIYILIAAIAVLAGLAYWFFILRDSPQVVVSPTPTETPVQTPRVATLSEVFSQPGGTINVSAGTDPRAEFLNQFNALSTPPGGQFQKLLVSSNETESLSVLEILDRFLVPYPAELKTAGGSDSAILLYGQIESFDSKGRVVANAPVGKRLVLATEITDSTLVSQALRNWEADVNMMASLFVPEKVKYTGTFLDSYYQGVAIRYKNFPNPDKSLDYAVVSASNGKLYLVFASSRESMFRAIDQLISFQLTE